MSFEYSVKDEANLILPFPPPRGKEHPLRQGVCSYSLGFTWQNDQLLACCTVISLEADSQQKELFIVGLYAGYTKK